MQPIGSQAASQAIVDARVLTGALMASSDPCKALRRYDLERRPTMNDITLRNRQFGPEAAMQLVEDRAPNGFSEVRDVISEAELEDIAKSFAVRSAPPRARSGQTGARQACSRDPQWFWTPPDAKRRAAPSPPASMQRR
jgi:2-polyprenyl-6-methoxyphenol hydroxylase-like FAD-dependent oxidoreductase